MNALTRTLSLAVPALLLSTTAAAHPGDALHTGLAAGVLHPFAGLDHVLAMLAVGLWSAQHDGAARQAIPLGFIAAMVVGGLLPPGTAAGGVEQGIATSVLVIGLAVALAARLPAAAAIATASGFAVFHGLAHAAELPAGTSAAAFGAGFVLSTAMLLAAGQFAGRRLAGRAWQRGAGAAVAASGAALLAVQLAS